MAGVNVDPPPINTRIVDSQGMPTQAMRDFIHRLWERTGGEDDNDSFLLQLVVGGAPRDRRPPLIGDEQYQYQPPDPTIGHEARLQALVAQVLAALKPADNGKSQQAIDRSETANMLALMRSEQVDKRQIGKGQVPIGGIIMYSGEFADIPRDYALCNGTNGTPNLTDKFIRATNTESAVGTTGGSNEEIVTTTDKVTGNSVATTTAGAAAGTDINAVTSVSYTDTLHNHDATVATIPAYYTLAFIMRLQ